MGARAPVPINGWRRQWLRRGYTENAGLENGGPKNIKGWKMQDWLEIAAQGIAQCKVSATRVVTDAALRRIG